MVLNKAELIASFQDETRILLHLVSKVDRAQLGYRPSPKQRSTLELLQYLSMMGPGLIVAAMGGAFDMAAWTTAEKAAASRDFDGTVAELEKQSERYAILLGDVSDADFRSEITMFGPASSRGAFLVNAVLCGCAAYRTQLFLYLKACGHEELNSANLWGGVDG